MASPQATARFEQLAREWQKGDSADAKAVESLLGQLKIDLSELGLLFPVSSGSTDVGALTSARDVLEIGAFQAVRSGDVPAFERYMSLLGSYYDDLASKLSPSVNEAPLTALSLLRLLSQNRIGEFHTLLETVPERITSSSEVGWVLELERSLMEGAYSRVWRLCQRSSPANAGSSSSLPRREFALFVGILVDTVRAEIAACDERAYASLPVKDAQTLLFFDAESDLRAFAAQRGWPIDGKNVVHFPASKDYKLQVLPKGAKAAQETDRELNKERVVSATLAYARELESIV